MASNYHIQKPYVLASLPRLLALPDGACVVGEVYGLRPGVKKRRRPEVVVGIDGEAANIYDVASSRLITSYPIPPQARFSCPPCSMRLRSGAGKSAATARFTYLATKEPARKLSLFKDTVDATGATTSATATVSLGRTADIVSIYSLWSGVAEPEAPSSADPVPSPLVAPSLIAVDQDGQVTCFDGDSLKEKYKTSISALSQELLPRGAVLHVEFAQMGLAADALKGLALGEGFLAGVSGQNTNQDVIAAITTVSGRQGGVTRYLHVLTVDPGQAVQIHNVRLPSPSTSDVLGDTKTRPTYRLDLLSGSLLALDGENVITYDLARSVPRIVSIIPLPGVTSFLRLSKSSILVASPTSFSVYNPVFKSLQASTEMDLRDGAASEAHRSCSLVSFFPQIELAVALVDSSLVAVQLEPPRTRSKKRRADGLLIDSIGRGVAKDEYQMPIDDANVLPKTCLPGTVSAAYLAQHKEDIQTADRLLLEEGDVPGFDEFLAEKLGIQDIPDWRWQRPLDALETGRDAMDETEDKGSDEVDANGVNQPPNGSGAAKGNTATTKAAAKRAKYLDPDRRWVVYAIGRILGIVSQQQQGQQRAATNGPRLSCKYPQSDILNYLVDAGHLTVANVRSALRGSLEGIDEDGSFLSEALPAVVAQVDPSFDLLVRWLYETKLGAVELLTAILLLMRSLELVPGGAGPGAEAHKPLLLTNGEAGAAGGGGGEGEGEGEGELDQLDRQLQLAEYFLQHVENDPRDLALDIAIGKLGDCPALATVQGLRRVFKTEEIRSLIEVLRKQLVDQGWATRYLDMELEGRGGDGEDAATPLNYSIRLIADLLCRCIDAVRPGEWLINDEATTAATDATDAATAAADLRNGTDSGGSGDFFASLKWQISAALEGVQEALYLRGLLGEVVRYASVVQRTGLSSTAAAPGEAGGAAASTGASSTRPVRVATPQLIGSGLLPLGLKAPAAGSLGGVARRHADVTATKVGSGGEVLKRSRRELGHLTSKKVGAYTLERIIL